MKVFLGLREISGYYSSLQKGFFDIGIKADFISYRKHMYEYGGFKDEVFSNTIRFLFDKSFKAKSKLLKKILLHLIEIIKIPAFVRYAFSYDIFIICFGDSFFYHLNYKEFWILKKMGKKVFFVFHGSDSRPRYMDGVFINRENVDINSLIEDTKRQKKKIEAIERYADMTFDNSSRAIFRNTPFVHNLYIGIPTAGFVDGKQKSKVGSKTIILHSPSNPLAKGSAIIEQVINELIATGASVEFIKLENVKNSEVLLYLERCDFIIDQLYSDTPMSGFATEAARMAKPTIVCGYFANTLKEHMNSKYIPPSYYVEPMMLKNAILKMVDDIEFRVNLGQQAFEFVKNSWSPDMCAKRFLDVAFGAYDYSVLINPLHINYIYGACTSKERLRYILSQIVNKGGHKALLVNRKDMLFEIENFLKEV